MRLLTYNIHQAKGLDGRVSLRRIAETIRLADPDVVALQEVARYPLVYEQPRILGRLLGMRAVFQANVVRRGRRFGNALLTRGAVGRTFDLKLPSVTEQRGCLFAEVDLGAASFAVGCVHLGLDRQERAVQLAHLAARSPHDTPLVLAGDFNAYPAEVAPLLSPRLSLPEDPPATYPAERPHAPIDLVAVTEHWRVVSLRALASTASDHLPMLAELELAV